MYSLCSNLPEYFSEICDEIRLFYSAKKIDDVFDTHQDGVCVYVFFTSENGKWSVDCRVFEEREEKRRLLGERDEVSGSALTVKKYRKRFVKKAVYDLLKAHTGKSVPWGSLTGVRPTKLARESVNAMGEQKARELFSYFDVSEKKSSLCFEITRNQQPFINSVQTGDIDIYVGIPFCKTRCSYCSFVSKEYAKNACLKDEYIDRLIYELKSAEALIKTKNVRCIYIGGGTPTALSAEELSRVMDCVHSVCGSAAEYTVEAGRPDTITQEKLDVIAEHGEKRISVNAQTTDGGTLKRIGREYDPKEFYKAFSLARNAGFNNINTDIILGLPGETQVEMEQTIKDVIALAPENITVHTLAIKNASYLAENGEAVYPEPETVAQMVEKAGALCAAAGYDPYYMYRQKYMSGNLENVGYAKKGAYCVYNIDIMEETVSVLAFGAGAVSKRVFGGENRIERAPNVKDIKTYNERIEQMAKRKLDLFE